MSFHWFHGHHSCVIQLIFHQILFSLQHSERLSLWEYCSFSLALIFWYMGALIMKYYMSIQWSKTYCVTKLIILSQCYISLFQSLTCYWLLAFMNIWQHSVFTELLYLWNVSNGLDTVLDVESSWQRPYPMNFTF